MKKIQYIQITEECNYRCRHCLYSCGPSGRTMDTTTIEEVVDNTPPDTKYFTLTGGEPTVVWETLIYTLSYIRERREQILSRYGMLVVETNGSWVTDPDVAFDILREFYEFG